jgi:hypothetical protein
MGRGASQSQDLGASRNPALEAYDPETNFTGTMWISKESGLGEAMAILLGFQDEKFFGGPIIRNFTSGEPLKEEVDMEIDLSPASERDIERLEEAIHSFESAGFSVEVELYESVTE